MKRAAAAAPCGATGDRPYLGLPATAGRDDSCLRHFLETVTAGAPAGLADLGRLLGRPHLQISQ